jgi:hypothetical protein
MMDRDLLGFLNIIWFIKSRGMMWDMYVARMGKIWVRQRGWDHLRDRGIDESTKLS